MRNDICFIILTLATTNLASLALAQESCRCAHCGCSQSCQKVCRLVCEDKKVDVICWGCKCEDFCVPGPSCRGPKHCETICDTCGDKGSEGIQVEPKKHIWFEWFPKGGTKTYTKTKLMLGASKVTISSHKWVLEDLCSQCAAKCESAAVPPGTEVPSAPALAENVIVIQPGETLRK